MVGGLLSSQAAALLSLKQITVIAGYHSRLLKCANESNEPYLIARLQHQLITIHLFLTPSTAPAMSLRSLLRSQPSIVGTAPPLGEIPEHPRSLIVSFLTAAIDAGIPEPHAITLITVDSNGFPDARVLIIKDINDDGNVAIATSAHSAKGRQLLENNKVALSWYCTPQARAIRTRGTATLADEEVIRADFDARSGRAKAIAKAGKQSEVIDSGTDRKALIDAKEKELQAQEGEGGGGEEMPDWQVWWIVPEEIEFWQGAKDRNHERLRYKRKKDGCGWEHATLWP